MDCTHRKHYRIDLISKGAILDSEAVNRVADKDGNEVEHQAILSIYSEDKPLMCLQIQNPLMIKTMDC
jgi:hypothetical protein